MYSLTEPGKNTRFDRDEIFFYTLMLINGFEEEKIYSKRSQQGNLIKSYEATL